MPTASNAFCASVAQCDDCSSPDCTWCGTSGCGAVDDCESAVPCDTSAIGSLFGLSLLPLALILSAALVCCVLLLLVCVLLVRRHRRHSDEVVVDTDAVSLDVFPTEMESARFDCEPIYESVQVASRPPVEYEAILPTISERDDYALTEDHAARGSGDCTREHFLFLKMRYFKRLQML